MKTMEGVLIGWDDTHGVCLMVFVTQKGYCTAWDHSGRYSMHSFRQRECARCLLRYTETAVTVYTKSIRLK